MIADPRFLGSTSLWDKWGLLVKMIMATTIISAIGCTMFQLFINWQISKLTIYYTDPTQNDQIIDITPDLYLQICALLEKISSWASLIGLLITPLTIYNGFKYTQLTRALRILIMAENIGRLAFCLIQSGFNLCLGYAQVCPQPILEAINFLVMKEVSNRQLMWFIKNCQILIAINRFSVIAFNGSYFERVQEWPFLQTLIALLLAWGEYYLQISFDFGFFFQIIVGSLNLVIDVVTFAKFRERKKKATVEKQFLFQMATNSAFILISFFLMPSILLIMMRFYGVWIGMTMNAIISLIASLFLTLGQSVSNLMLIREPKRSPKTDLINVSAFSSTQYPSTTRVKPNTNQIS